MFCDFNLCWLSALSYGTDASELCGEHEMSLINLRRYRGGIDAEVDNTRRLHPGSL